VVIPAVIGPITCINLLAVDDIPVAAAPAVTDPEIYVSPDVDIPAALFPMILPVTIMIPVLVLLIPTDGADVALLPITLPITVTLPVDEFAIAIPAFVPKNDETVPCTNTFPVPVLLIPVLALDVTLPYTLRLPPPEFITPEPLENPPAVTFPYTVILPVIELLSTAWDTPPIILPKIKVGPALAETYNPYCNKFVPRDILPVIYSVPVDVCRIPYPSCALPPKTLPLTVRVELSNVRIRIPVVSPIVVLIRA